MALSRSVDGMTNRHRCRRLPEAVLKAQGSRQQQRRSRRPPASSLLHVCQHLNFPEATRSATCAGETRLAFFKEEQQ